MDISPQRTPKEYGIEALRNKYHFSKDNGIKIKLCNLNLRERPKITTFRLPNRKDMLLFDQILQNYSKNKNLSPIMMSKNSKIIPKDF